MNKRNFIILLLLLFIIWFSFISFFSSKEQFQKNENNDNIIGYFHICQKENWEKSFDLIFHTIKKHGLYDGMKEMRLGIVNDDGKMLNNERFNDPKIRIIYTGKSDEYERPTLLHMKKSSFSDPKNTKYFYLHTKGIRHYNTKNEDKIMKWIQDMLYWNIEKWQNAVKILQDFETYGCNYNNTHYSGNFWWTTREHVQKLPDNIGDNYTDPEDWILKNKDKMYCANNCSENYKPPYPENLYKI